MKKPILFFPILILLTTLLFSGCLVTSIYPLGTEDDIVFDENLIGIWKEADGGDFWVFSQKDEKTYNLILFDDKEKGEYLAKLVKLEDKLFLDIYPERLDTGNILTDILMQPTHTFMSFSLDDSGLSLGFTDLDWFTKRIDRNEDIGLKYVFTEDEILTLTASTGELQAFYLLHADDEEFFDLDNEKLIKSKEGEYSLQPIPVINGQPRPDIIPVIIGKPEQRQKPSIPVEPKPKIIMIEPTEEEKALEKKKRINQLLLIDEVIDVGEGKKEE